MSTMLLSNSIEPFFSTSADSKDYFHSFSESIINFSPGLMSDHSPNSLNTDSQPQQDNNQDQELQHHHHELRHHHDHHQHPQSHHHNPHQQQHQHEPANSANLNQLAHHSVLSDLFKCADDNSFQDFHTEHNSGLCGPCVIDDYNMDVECNWSAKPPDQWQPVEVAEWIRNWAHRNEIQDIEVAHLLYNQMSGLELCQMQREYFTSVCPQFGNSIYDSLQSLLSQFGSTSQNYMSFQNSSQMQQLNNSMHSNAEAQIHGNPNLSMQQQHQQHHSSSIQDQDMPHSVDQFAQLSSLDTISSSLFDTQTVQLNYSPSYTSVSDSDRESTSSNLSGMNERRIPINPYYSSICSINQGMIDASRTNNIIELKVNSPPVTISLKRNGRRGRPPKKETKSRSKGNGKLWEFIRDLLLNPITNPSLIRWERREDGIFKFIQSDKVAKMWGERKQNPRMTYEKLSRAMRYYYKSQVLLPVFGRRLVYKFGPNATGWRPQFDMVKTSNGYSA